MALSIGELDYRRAPQAASAPLHHPLQSTVVDLVEGAVWSQSAVVDLVEGAVGSQSTVVDLVEGAIWSVDRLGGAVWWSMKF